MRIGKRGDGKYTIIIDIRDIPVRWGRIIFAVLATSLTTATVFFKMLLLSWPAANHFRQIRIHLVGSEVCSPSFLRTWNIGVDSDPWFLYRLPSPSSRTCTPRGISMNVKQMGSGIRVLMLQQNQGGQGGVLGISRGIAE